MSWEDQGRQYHAWFGHGTGGDGAELGTQAVGAALAGIGAGRRGAFAAYLDAGGASELKEALPLWAGASGLDAAGFRRAAVGAGFGAQGAAAVQAAGRAYAGGDGIGAGAKVAEAVESEGRSGGVTAWRMRGTRLCIRGLQAMDRCNP